MYHQVRCMIGILFLIGRRHEEPSVCRYFHKLQIIQHMFQSPEKPTYHMASEDCLVLWDSTFDGLEFTPECYSDPKNNGIRSFYLNLSQSWCKFSLSRSFYHQHLMSLQKGVEGTNHDKTYLEHLPIALHRCSYTPIQNRKRKSP